MKNSRLLVLIGLALLLRAGKAAGGCATCPNASFGPAAADYRVRDRPQSVIAADFDGDGRTDLVSDGFFLRGLPAGRFAQAVQITPNFFGTSGIAVDVDQDGRMDLVVLEEYAAVVLRGNGDGTFSEPVRYSLPPYPDYLAIGDVNGDGLPDIAVTIINTGFSVLLNQGNGTFGLPTTYGAGNVSGPAALGDFNGDGKLDVLLGYYAGQLFLGNGDGTFLNTPLPAPSGQSPVAADFDRDGKLDLAYFAGGGLSISRGRGDGTFDPPVQVGPVDTSIDQRDAIRAVDVNGDGWLDFVVASFSNAVVIIRSDGAGGFLPPLVYPAGPEPGAIAVAELDGDGTLDTVVANLGADTLTVFHGNPDGSLETSLQLASSRAALASGDLDGDSNPDLVAAGTGLAVFMGDGLGNFSPGYSNSGPINIVAVSIADVNHDGHLDIVAVGRGPATFPSDGTYWVFLGNGSGGFTSLPSVHLDFAPNSAALALLDTDFFPELLISGIGSGIHILKGNGDGTFVDGSPIGAGLTLGDFAVADLRGVGKLDVAAIRYVDGTVSVFLGNGDGTFQAGSDYLGAGSVGIGVGDFNGDGKADIISGLSLLRGRGDGTFEPAFTFPGPYFGVTALAVLDFNGDGKPDVALTGTDTVLLKGNGDGTFTESGRYLAGGLASIVDDWNNDGKPDIAVAYFSSITFLFDTNCSGRRLALTTEPATCAAPGAPLGAQPAASLLDDGGNIVTCASGSVSASLVPGTGTAGATLGGATTKPLASGTATFTDLSINLAGDNYVLDVSHPPARSARSRPISVHAAYSVSIAGPAFVCPTTSTPFSADPGFDTYLWTVDGAKIAGGRTIQLVGLAAGPHTLAVLATRAGCSASASLPIESGVVPPSVSNNGPVCAGEALQLTASSVPGGTYAWTGPNGFASAAQNPTIPAATLAASGIYSVTATLNGCTSAPTTTSVTVTPLPYVPVAQTTGSLCAGETLQLTASTVPGATYAWTGPNGFTSSLQNPSIPSAIAADSGVYAVTVTVNGCTSPAATVSVSVAACQQRPVAVSSDASGNAILEPGETAVVAPTWLNTTASSVPLTGVASSFTGPTGATYTLPDAAADYGTVASGATASCISTGDCYSVGVSAPATRPLLHWDAALAESLSSGDAKTWSIHIGASFTDVATNSPYYRFVETLLHDGVTTGCGAGAYCPGSSVTRAQMAVFLLTAEAGTGFTPPPATGIFLDVPAANSFARWIEELARRGVTAGCGNGNFCPNANVTRAQMAVFLLVTREGAAYVPPAPIGLFSDVPAGNPFAPWIEELFHRGIAAGCGNGDYCPASPVSRAQMAVLLATTFGLSL